MSATDVRKDQSSLNSFRIVSIGIMLVLCALTEYYFHFVLGVHIVYTHLFYIPIVLAAIWWGLKGGLPVSLFLAFLHVVPYLPRAELPIFPRALMFIVVGSVMGIVSSRRKRAEKALQESEERFRALTESTSDWLWEVDENAVYTYASPKVKELLGYEPEEIIGKTLFDLMPPEEAKRVAAEFEAIAEARKLFDRLENANLHKDGRIVVLETSGVPIFDANRDFRGYRGIDRDITERKWAEDALLREKAYTDNIIKTMIDTLIVVDPDGKIKTVNQATLNLLGYKKEELIGKPVGIIFAEEEEEEEELIFKGTRLQKLIKEDAVCDYDMTYLAKDGRKIPMTFSGSAMRDKEGKLLGVVGVARDMRGIKKLISDLGEAKTYAENIITNFLDTLIVVNPDGTICTVNQATLELLEYKKEELIGKPVGIIFAEEEEEVLFTGKLKDLAEKGTVRNYEMTYVTKSGRHIPMSFNGSVMRDEKGDLVGIVAGAKDMSAIKKLIDDLEKSRDEIQRALGELRETQAKLIQAGKMAAMGTLGAGIAHQLNQPLAGIRGFTQTILLEMDKKNPPYEDLKKIEEQTSYMRDIIKNISGFARQSEFRKEPININEPIEKALQLLSEQLRLHGIRMVKNLDSKLPKVNADANQMQQVFVNFIVNAREAMDTMPNGVKKELIITTQLRSEKSGVRGQKVKGKKRSTKQDFVEIWFEDTGPGIPDKLKDKIFDPFFTTKGPRSIGLGLFLNYQMIEDHNGSIEVESSEGKGTVFRLTLPAIKKKTRAEDGR